MFVGVDIDTISWIIGVPPDLTVESIRAVGEPYKLLVIFPQFVLSSLDPVKVYTERTGVTNWNVVSIEVYLGEVVLCFIEDKEAS